MQQITTPASEDISQSTGQDSGRGDEAAAGDIASQLSDEDQARSGTYSILSSLLSDIPDQDLVDYLLHIEKPQPDQEIGHMGQAWQELNAAAQATDPVALDDEFHALFVGVGRGEVIPYASWHLTGFLMDKPLSELRDDMRMLGFEPDPELKEPEDHISAICETMAILIIADDIEGFQQRRFYLQHIHPWAEKFFKTLSEAESANFYRAVGNFGQQFIQLENQYLNVQEH